MATETPRFDPVLYKETTRQQWQAAATAWHRWGSTLATWLDPATEIMLDMAGIGPERRRSAGGRCEETTMWYSTVGFLVTLTLSLLAAPLAADAQAPAKVPRIGVLSSVSPPATSVPSPFVQGLRDLGYVEGQHITFAYRYAEGNLTVD